MSSEPGRLEQPYAIARERSRGQGVCPHPHGWALSTVLILFKRQPQTVTGLGG